jgi:phosphatidylserine/phosphatidylglycerophosphate/cardiolipin synthase-like enzyme
VKRLNRVKWLIVVLILAATVGAQQTPTAPEAPSEGGEQPAPVQLYPDNAVQLTQFAEVAQAISSASSEIMIATDVLRSQEIAEALRMAIVNRSVSVYILTPEESVEDPASYLVSLALAGANVRVGPVEGSFVTLDRQSVVVGVLVSGVVGLPGYEEKDRTILVPDEAYTAPYVEAFYTSFEAAPVLDPETLALFNPQPEGGEE